MGVEGDWGSAGGTTTLGGMVYPGNVLEMGIAADSFSVKTGWDASVRGRIGFLAAPSLFIYATGGAAWLQVDVTSTCNKRINGNCSSFPPANPIDITDSTTRSGWGAASKPCCSRT